ncbi:MAG: tetratricopeptide repeat protein [Burkholderiales bacterium]|nr:tetratricopeptide repeat protein [Burkholderiales bacterium]
MTLALYRLDPGARMRPAIRALPACALAASLLTGAAPAAAGPDRPEAVTAQAPSPAPAPRVLRRAPRSVTPPGRLPEVELTPGLLYELLAAEIAGQRGAASLALGKYLELAQRTRDPRIAQRAVEIAFYERNNEKALEAARLWVAADPDNLDARQAIAGLLVAAGLGEEAYPHLERLLAAEGTNVAEAFIQFNRLLARSSDRKATLSIVQRLAARHPDVAEAHGAVAQAAANAGEDDLAIREARRAAKLKPEWEFPALLAAQLLAKRSTAEATEELRAYLAVNPSSSEARMAFARSLVSEKKYAEARTEFQRIEKQFPNNPDVLYALGLLALDAKDYASAESSLTRLLGQNPRDPNLVQLYLGQVAEEQRQYDLARERYRKIDVGNQFMAAQSRIARTYARQGRIAEGRAHLQGLVPVNNEQRVQIIMAEAQLLREANQNREAFEVLEKGLERLPNHVDLLYDFAMAAEKVSRMDLLEANLKKVIQLKPDHAHAYNALGYSLADRNERLAEARELIEKALKIAPDDAMIIDSMGWVLYRLGDLPRALELLTRAYGLMPDAEIGAHLGEVLWKLGRVADAERIWNEALARSPDNETLRATIRRLKP